MTTPSSTNDTLHDALLAPHQISFAAAPFMAQITEELQGKPVIGTPTKILGAKPNAMGKSTAALIKRRYPGVTGDSVESMSRLRLIAVTLNKSYLIIKFFNHDEDIKPSSLAKAFADFNKGLCSGLVAIDSSDLIIRRKKMARLRF